MGEPVRVVVLGTGQMGARIARLLCEKADAGLALAGVFARRAERAGRAVGEALGLADAPRLSVEGDLAGLIERAAPRVAIQATCSRLDDAAAEVGTCLERGVHVISIAEELAWPAAEAPETAQRLDRLARRHGAVLLGTGVNPGFVLDLLVIALTGVCERVQSIRARRVNDLSPYGPSVLRTQGVGLTPERFRLEREAGRVVGHLGFPQSIGMIASSVGWRIERVEQTREPIVSRVRRQTPFVTVEPGQVAGCLHTAVAYREGRAVISLEHPQQIHPELEGVETGDAIEIEGTPGVRLAGSPEIPGGVATAALAVNVIPRVLAAAPGLRSMAELPVPAALLGDVRAVRRAERVEAGRWVELRSVVLEPGERAPRIPEETQRVPLELRVKGVLVRDAALGERAEIVTPAGRQLRGILHRSEPAYTHGFGRPVPELRAVGDELRARLAAEAPT